MHSQNQELLRTPISSEAEGGAIHPEDAKAGGNNLKLGWQILGHFGHIEPKLPTIKARDSVAEGYEAGLRRQSPQIGTIVKGIVDRDPRATSEPKLPTPVVNDMGAGKTVEWWDEWCAATKKKHNNSNGHGPSLNVEMLRLLPTPNTMDGLPARTPEKIAESKERTPAGYSNLCESVVNDLFPTPVAQEGIKAPSQQTSEVKGKNGQVWLSNVAKDIEAMNEPVDLIGTPRTSSANGSTPKQVANGATKSRIEDQVLTTSWGKFEPAIQRWEQVIDRPAPAPTKPDGKDGQHRLSSEFTEWLMGLPEGWVTDPELGLTRNEQLKLCGNGVVPQQAALALRMMLSDFIPEKNDDAVMPTLTTNGTGRHSAGYDSLGTLQMLEVAKGVLPKEYTSWEQVNAKIPAEWRDGNAGKENK